MAYSVSQAHAELAAAVRWGDAEAAEQARRAMKLALTEDRIARAIEAAPPLDAETHARIVALIPAPVDDREASRA